MSEKMNLEQFQQIRNQLDNIVEQFEEYTETHENFDEETVQNEFMEKYFSIQNNLLNHDLSDIPFAAWKNFIVFSDETHMADFSKTRANIDFALIEYMGNGNFKGCNVRNLEKIEGILNPKNFDEQVIKEHATLFLSDIFDEEFKNKYYNCNITISDLATLSNQQLDEVKQKGIKLHMDYRDYNALLFENLGIDKLVQLYKRSQQEYEVVNKIVNSNSKFSGGVFSRESYDMPTFDEFLGQFKNAAISELKNVCFDYVKKYITNSRSLIIKEDYPELFITENANLFLKGVNVPEEVKERYLKRDLKIQDLLDYPELLENFPIDYFLDNGIYIVQFIKDNYGMGKFQELVKKHKDVFIHIQQKNEFNEFQLYLTEGNNLNRAFTEAVKEYFLNHGMPEQFITINEGKTIYNIPDWLLSMNFQFVEKLNTANDLLQYTDSIFVLDKDQRRVLNILNIDNIKKFEQETGFFTHKGYEWSKDIEMFNAFSSYLHICSSSSLAKIRKDFKNGNLSYEEFSIQFANLLDIMRKNNVFTDFADYNWIQGEFRNNHPEMFIDLDAPEELATAFYKNRITPEFLFQHKEYIPYLVNKNLLNTIKADMSLSVPGLIDAQGHIFPNNVNFIEEYVSRYGNEKLLMLIVKYGAVLSNITITSFNKEIENEQLIEQSIRNSIYGKIVNGKMDYSYLLSVPEIVLEYPEIFVNFESLTNIPQEEIGRLTNAFYTRNLRFDDIKKYPELATILKDKNLFIAFAKKNGKHIDGRILLDTGYSRVTDKKYSDLELLEVFGNEKFLQLCAKYGRYMDGIVQHFSKDITIKDGKYIYSRKNNMDFEHELSVEDISKEIEEIIIRESKLGNLAYYPEDAPAFLKESSPELFLSNDAPDELKTFFYNYNNNYPMSFETLQKHKDWLPFLKDKALTTSLLRNDYLKQDLIKFLETFGEEKAIKLGINKAETVKEMMKAHQVDLMKSWYDKTGGKFVPDFVVMQNFELEEADKFLVSGANWSNLMRIQSFAKTPESRAAMLKLAYSFGAFDQDQRGFKKLQDLLTSLPRNISSNYAHIMDSILSLEEHGKNLGTSFGKPEGYEEYLQLKETLVKEGLQFDPSKKIFSQIYKKNEDESYSLTINPQSYPKSSQLIRNIIEFYPDAPTLTPNKAHQLFGGFEMKYDPDFREFLLANIDEIIAKPEYVRFVATVQRQFSNIKTMNSNRALTWELAISFVQANKYTSVNIGNERVAEISAIAGYSQADFNILQQIYNYGKQRTFSSIPRIEQKAEKRSGKYTYETLRLDDPLAMAIGTLTDCCQELNNSAEVCMEHSMVDKNGRVFIIKDDQGNVVAQSWVWRNKDVLCFDNIEIPDKAFARVGKEHPELGRKGFSNDIFEVYKQAAHDLIEEDEKVYKELLESGKITQEQYDGLRLGKVTVGLGFNDIAESLKQNSTIDKGNVSRPLPFKEPVKLNTGLYIKDSITQYVLEEREDRQEFDGETLPIHNDTYIEYNDSNFTEKYLLSLEKLEITTKGESRYLETFIDDNIDSEHLVTEIARNYGLNPETTRIIMNPNFAIIYDVNGDKLKIGDLFFNTIVDNEQQQMDIESQVVMQMRLAFEQIANDKEIDVSTLNEKQREMYARITGLTDEIDMERGIGHARY